MEPLARVQVITVSDRSARGERPDTSGPLLAALMAELGFEVADVVVVPDDLEHIRTALRTAVAGEYDVVVTTGGTGFSPSDVTPEATLPLLDRQAPGLAEAIRQQGREKVPTSVLSRGVAGTIGQTVVVNLPGSPGGVRDGVAALAPVLAHAVAQMRGGDH